MKKVFYAPRLTGSFNSAFCGRVAASASDGGDFNDFFNFVHGQFQLILVVLKL